MCLARGVAAGITQVATPDQRPLLDVPAAPPAAEWIALMPYSHDWVTGKPLRDHKYRVLWWEHPDTFLDYLIW